MQVGIFIANISIFFKVLIKEKKIIKFYFQGPTMETRTQMKELKVFNLKINLNLNLFKLKQYNSRNTTSLFFFQVLNSKF